ncbi:MAG: DUF1802 family protein [Terrimicrobiaceae bacterium]|nr:DUF1802 family protein [Terrimicrobiaceae bacterium]
MIVAFKEWALVCEALGSGRQSLILRKGGIAEGRAGFAFQHEEFFLFPTWFHEQLERTTLPPDTPVPQALNEEIEIAYAATVEWTRLVTDLAVVGRLRDLHVWRDSIVEERFHYDATPGIHVAFVRVFRLDPPQRLRMEKKFGGCRSWVEMPAFDGSALVSVISDEEHARRRAMIEELLAG